MNQFSFDRHNDKVQDNLSTEMCMKSKLNPTTTIHCLNEESLENKKRRKEDYLESRSDSTMTKKHASNVTKFDSSRNTGDKVSFSLLGDICSNTHEIGVIKKRVSSAQAKILSVPSKQNCDLNNAAPYSLMDESKTNNDSGHLRALPSNPKGDKVVHPKLHNLLPPMLISKAEVCGVEITANTLRKMASSEECDVFNRKTGIIMRGKNGIPLKTLPVALQNHVEYEVILPHSKVKPSIYHQSRTSAAARIFQNVEPQRKICVGKFALISDGPHKGLYGKVDSCLPGGWFVLSNVFRGEPLEMGLVVHSKHLKFLRGRILDRSNTDESSAKHNHLKESDESTEMSQTLAT